MLSLSIKPMMEILYYGSRCDPGSGTTSSPANNGAKREEKTTQRCAGTKDTNKCDGAWRIRNATAVLSGNIPAHAQWCGSAGMPPVLSLLFVFPLCAGGIHWIMLEEGGIIGM